ncbi:interleukin-32-like isoform X3 [Bos indicus]|uniref:Interleukin-32-like isoform X3 n=1 Tax=Bos indicus TaxID=9915 RepID=A0ABM4RJA0_BOSIN
MCFAKGVPYDQASLRSIMHKRVDDFCDKMGNEPEEAQMEAALDETEEGLSEDICEFIEDHIQENLPESSPLLQEARQGVRRRIQRPSVSARLEVQNPEESIWARALGRFQVILQSLQQRCWDALTWLREKAVTFLEAICSVVKAVLGVLTDFCSSVGQLFGNLIQV